MAQLLNEIEWDAPILPEVTDPAWEAEVKRRMGKVSRVYRFVAPSPWLREFVVALELYRVTQIPLRLVHIGNMVAAQENACRYCYGATRAYMRVLGYSERLIERIERDAQLAELDERERAFIQFCRSLSRSRPRPARAERDALVALGFSPLAVTEMAFLIAGSCVHNRVATFIAAPPEAGFERFAGSWLGGLLGLLGPLTRAMQARKLRRAAAAAPASVPPTARFGAVVQALAGLPAAQVMHDGIEGAFASPVLRTRTKALMFAVVARALDCTFCLGEARAMLGPEGFSAEAFDAALGALESPLLEPQEARILSWVRDTVHYKPIEIQQRTRELAAALGPEATLEAVGVASLANATVRLAMLLA